MRAVALAFLMSAALIAQSQVSGAPAFEVATIRASAPGTRQYQRVLPSRIDFVSTPLQTIVLAAFKLKPYQLSAPDWLKTVRFDIQATYPRGATQADVPEMLRTLLKERFGLVTNTEPRLMDVFDLVVGNAGIKMREVQPADDLNKDFVTPSGQRSPLDSVQETVDGPVRTMVVPGELGTRWVTSRSVYELRTTPNRTQLIDAVRISMSEFIVCLRGNLNRPVIDNTGLTGLYQFKVELDRMEMASSILGNRDGRSLDEPSGVSTFKAVEGLGLKLEQRRSPVDVLVVDKISRTPTDN